MNLSRNFIKHSSLIVLFCTSNFLLAQLNPPEVNRVILKNTIDTFLINSYGALQITGWPEHDLETEWNYISSNLYAFIYNPETDYVGDDLAHVQYRELGTGNQHPVNFTTINYKVVNSIINANTDFIDMPKNAPNTAIGVLGNDNTTHGDLEIIGTVQELNGAAVYIGDSIYFTPDPDFIGMAYVTYLILDDAESTSQGVININVLDDINGTSETINLTTSSEHDLFLALPTNSFSIDERSDDFGETTLSGAYMTYSPIIGADGIDIIIISDDNNNTRTYQITVIAVDHDYGFVRDDIFYTAVNTDIEFNVLENDLINNYPIIAYSDELVSGTTSGSFNYTPETDFDGIVDLEYTVWNGFEFQSGAITIYVHDFEPKAIGQYNFKTIENIPVFIRYEIPIDDNYFEVSNAPIHGYVEYIDDEEILDLSCESITAKRSVVYYPDENYLGEDEFEMLYCINEQPDNCKLVKIAIDIVAEVGDCHCVDNCVWPGDANNDGIVRADDLVAIAYNMGEVGEERADIDYEEWLGQTASNWDGDIFNGTLNNKYSDSDGDGIVSVEDTIALSTNYASYHNLLKNDVLTIEDYPFELVSQSTDLDSGDVWVIDIVLGTTEAQVIDLHGLSFAIALPSNLVDSSSLKVNFFEDSWFVANAPSIQMSRAVGDGYVEAAFARTNRVSSSGHGIIGQSVCIIEEEIDGTRLNSDRIPIRAKLTNATGIDAYGNRVRLPDAETVVYLNVTKNNGKTPLENKLINYPNPAHDIMNIHFNGGNIIEEITVFNVQGKQVQLITNLNTTHHILDVSNFSTGLYILQVKSPSGVVSKKIEVIK